MAELYLVRHGQASFGGDSSEHYDQLSALGKRQALWLGEYFAERQIAFDACIVGTQKRHYQTAEAIAGGLGVDCEPQCHAGLDEYDFYGLFAALGNDQADLKALAQAGKREFYRGLKQVLTLWQAGRIEAAPESWDAFYSRVSDAMKTIQQCSARRMLVVSSGGVIGTMVGMALNAPPSSGIELNLQIYNCSVSRFFFNRDALKLASFNQTPHLDRSDRFDAISYG